MPGGDLRQANLKALYDRAQQYEDAGFRGLFRYLQLIDKMMEDGLDLAPAKVVSEKEDVVRIIEHSSEQGARIPRRHRRRHGKRIQPQGSAGTDSLP